MAVSPELIERDLRLLLKQRHIELPEPVFQDLLRREIDATAHRTGEGHTEDHLMREIMADLIEEFVKGRNARYRSLGGIVQRDGRAEATKLK